VFGFESISRGGPSSSWASGVGHSGGYAKASALRHVFILGQDRLSQTIVMNDIPRPRIMVFYPVALSEEMIGGESLNPC